LRLIDQTVASEKQIHIICDNYATHKHERVQRWMAGGVRPTPWLIGLADGG